MGGGGGQPRTPPPRGKFSPIRPPPVKFMTAHKLKYSDSDFRLIMSVYSDFSSDILKKYVKRNQMPLNLKFVASMTNGTTDRQVGNLVS